MLALGRAGDIQGVLRHSPEDSWDGEVGGVRCGYCMRILPNREPWRKKSKDDKCSYLISFLDRGFPISRCRPKRVLSIEY